MSYVKLPKGVSDYAVGYQSVNQALDNNRALYDQLDAKHSLGVGGGAYGDPFLEPGQHDDTLVARTAADFVVDATGAVVISYAQLGGILINGAPQYVADGKWKVYVTTPRLLGAVATVKDTSLVDRYAQCRISSDTDGTFVMVTTWDVSGGVLVNVDFSLVIWSDGVA